MVPDSHFNDLGGKRPQGWKDAVCIASWVQIDEMRTLLELHYDDVHFEKFKHLGKTGRKRTSEYRVFLSAPGCVYMHIALRSWFRPAGPRKSSPQVLPQLFSLATGQGG